ncbi:MgtC/SapB family protein [soil metagenome]
MGQSDIFNHLVHLGIAYLFALPIGWDRERYSRSAGLRTFPLVAVASCGFVQTAISVLGSTSQGQARILEGLITGIGFIGGGAILKKSDAVSGTATAASLWTTGAIGASVGYGQYDIGFVLACITFFTLRFLTPLKTPDSEAPHE